ncbi:glutamate-rich protein 2 isoform X2 [Pungitius pungitius]|uniref:glutamate-rich protein 2 isoform X2 n=1 Tax=Pungitius pungitius TaxID=134920 RepID=UPI002E101107
MDDLTNVESPDSIPTATSLPTRDPNAEVKETAGEDVEDEDIETPVQLIMEFLGAVMGRDYRLASQLCRMILIYEPDHPEASEFLPLIQSKLLKEQEEDQSTDEEDDDDEDSGSNEESSQSSGSDDDDEEENQVNSLLITFSPHGIVPKQQRQ